MNNRKLNDFVKDWMTKNMLVKYFGFATLDLLKIVETHLNQTLEMEEADDIFGGIFGGYYDYYGYDDSDESAEKECMSANCKMILEEVKKCIIALTESVGVKPGIPFGSFLSNFLPANTFYGMGKESPFNSFEVSSKAEGRILWQHQGPIHEYFSNLSQSFGFSENESVSLYDLPQILAIPSFHDYESKNSDRNFLFTRQKHYGEGSKGLQRKCKSQWLDYIKNNR